jgi:VWFA-related protein
LVSLSIGSGLLAQESSPSLDSATKPAARIDLFAIGYHAPSRTDRLSDDEASVSVDFVDADHVLLTFDPKKLMHRLPGCPPDHQDRLIRAAIVELPGGKVVKEADWYLHDRRRYLWPLSPGKFLLRKLNDLYVVDSSLRETLLLSSPKDLLWVTVTPDGGQIVVETAAEPRLAKDPKLQPSAAPAMPKFVAQFLDANTLAPKRTLPLNQIVTLNGTSTGYVDLVRKGDIWLIRFGPTPAKRHNIARVRSHTVPSILYSSNNSLVVGRCPAPNCDYSVTAFTVSGHRLWQQHWSRYRTFPAVTRNADNSRFGVSSLRFADAALAAKPGKLPDEDDAFEPDISQLDVFEQQIQILETASGNPVLSVTVSPAVMSGQNFSLSPDGGHLVVLNGSAMELFDLPLPAEQELEKFSALKADVQDLYALGSSPDSSSPADDTSGNPNLGASTAEGAQPSENRDPSIPTADADISNRPSSSAGGSSEVSSPEVSSGGQKDPNSPPVTTNETNPPAPTGPVPTFRVSTKAVVVDVVVTDSKGHPVKGLVQQDFHLAEDGKPQDLHSFREFTGNDDQPKTATSPPAPQSLPAAVPAKPSANFFSNDTRVAESGSVTMILFDLLNTPLQDQVFARQQLLKFLQSKPKNSQLALCTLSGGASSGATSHLRLIQGFTADETLLLAAARGKKALPKNVRWQVSASGTENSVDRVASLAQSGETSGFQGLSAVLQSMQAEQQVTDTDERAGITLESMMLLSRYLSGIPGRKNVVWLSGSFPISISATTNSGNPALDNPNYTYKIKLVTNLLAEAQIAVYPVDVRGLLGGGLAADNSGGMGGPTTVAPVDFSASSVIAPTPNIPQDMQSLAREAAERDTLTQFATATGGKAFYNSNGIREAIETAVEQSSNYYTLSYRPTNKLYDGKFRKIKVMLSEKGYTLHYRQGYYADDSNTIAKDAELSRRTRAVAMQHGSPQSRQLLFSARVVPVGGKKKVDRTTLGDVLVPSKTSAPSEAVEVQHYSIDYSFEGSELRFVPLANANYRNVVTLMATSFDREGQMLTGMSNVGTSDLEPAVYQKVIAGEFSVHQEADVPVEAASLRLGIQDQMTNHIGTVEIPLPVPPAPNSPRGARNTLPEIEPD